MAKTREDLNTYALLSERTERFSDMFAYMLEIIELGEGLSEEERNLLSVACKNVVGPKRSSCRCLAILEEKNPRDMVKMECIKELREKVVAEVNSICTKLVDHLSKFILDKTKSPSDMVFYLKMCGDYFRYLAEVLVSDDRTEISVKAAEYYGKAQEIAQAELQATSPIRLGLMLNMSVYYYEIEDDVKKAQKVARAALDGAVDSMNEGPQAYVKECELILQLLRDNLTLWNAESAISSSSEEFDGTKGRPEDEE